MEQSSAFRVAAFVALTAGMVLLSFGISGHIFKFGSMVLSSMTASSEISSPTESVPAGSSGMPAAGNPTPSVGGETPVAVGSTPSVGGETPVAVGSTPSVGGGTLAAVGSKPLADGPTPAGSAMVLKSAATLRMAGLAPLANGLAALVSLILMAFVLRRWIATQADLRGRFLKTFFLYEALSMAVVVVLFPFFWMLCTSFKPSGQELIINEANPFDIVPNEPTTANFLKVLKWDKPAGAPVEDEIERKKNFSTYFLNSLLVASTAAFLVTLFSSMAGYVFAKKELPYKGYLFALLMGTMMIPGMMYMVPQFFMISKMGLCGSKLAMFLPHLASVFGVFMLKQFMETIPGSLLEAARIDGASEWQLFSIIIVPLSMPILLTLFLLTFLFHWSNFLWQLIVTDFANPLSITLPVGLALFRGQYTSDLGLIMSASCFSIVPIAVLFMIAQRYFIEGMTQGAVKE